MTLRPLLSAILLSLASFAAQADDAKSAPSAQTQNPPKPAVSMDDIRAFTAVFNLVKQGYVEPVDDKVLMQNAIHGLLAGLDPHSEYLEPHEMAELNEDTSGS